MNQHQGRFLSFDSNPGMTIPVDFWTDFPLVLPIKTKTKNSMKNPVPAQEKPLFPMLFQNNSYAGQRTLKRAAGNGQVELGEMMLDAKRLEAVLKGVVRRKKASVRRISAGRLN
jgi:hypothetical protein